MIVGGEGGGYMHERRGSEPPKKRPGFSRWLNKVPEASCNSLLIIQPDFTSSVQKW